MKFSEIHKITHAHITENPYIDTFKKLSDGVNYVYAAHVIGDICEFDTMTGRSAVAIATAVRMAASRFDNTPRGDKKVWFFDSFEGLPPSTLEPDTKSPHVQTGTWGAGTCSGLDEFQFTKKIKHFLNDNQFNVHKGWFKDTISNLQNTQIAMLHIDGDLYESAIDVLMPLFNNANITEGGIIFFDDFNCNRASNKFGERRAWTELCKKYKVDYEDLGAYGLYGMSKRFIIHDYKGMVKT